MEERIPEKNFDLAEYVRELKELPLTVETDYDSGEYCMQVREFPYAIESGSTKAECESELLKSLKGWAESLMSDYENWLKGHETEVPYLVKILLSGESELRECLRYVK